MIEIIFSGFSTAFLHPFWGEVLEGAHEVFSRSGYRIVLNHILADPETHLFDRETVSLSEAVGRMTVGPGEKWLLDLIAASHRPMVCVGDEVYGPDVPQVCFDFFRGINDAVEYLVRQRKCRKIGFIGHVEAWINPGLLQKFNAYVYAVQRFMQVDRCLMVLASAGGRARRRGAIAGAYNARCFDHWNGHDGAGNSPGSECARIEDSADWL